MKNIYKILCLALVFVWVSERSYAQDTPITWTDLVGVVVEDGNLRKTAANGASNGGAASVESLAPGEDGSASFTVHAQQFLYFGMSAANFNASKNTISYSFLVKNSNLQIRENGTRMATISGGYAVGDKLKIERVGTTITYVKNDEIVYTSTVPSNGALLVDVSIINQNHEIKDALISSGITGIPSTPNAPTNLTFISATTNSISFSWNDNSDNESGFLIQRAPGGSNNFNDLVTIDSNNGNADSFTDEGLLAGTPYDYRVAAINGPTITSDFSNTISVATNTNIPDAPSALSINVSGDFLALNWSDNSANEEEFRIERSVNSTNNFTPLATLMSHTTTYEDQDVIGGNVYYYRVIAANFAGTSSPSNTASGQLPDAPPPSSGGGDIVWTNLVGVIVDGDNVLRKTAANGTNNGGASSEQILAPGAEGGTSFTVHGTVNLYYGMSDTDVNASKNTVDYSFLLRSSNSLQVRENGQHRLTVGTYGIGDVLTIARKGETVEYRKNDEVVYTSGVPSTGQLLVDVSITDNGNEIRDAIFFEAGNSEPLDAPSNLNATSVAFNSVSMNWSHNSSNEDEFGIFRSDVSGGPYSEVSRVGSDVTSFIHSGPEVIDGTTYYYVVKALNGESVSSPSNEIMVITGLRAPINLAVVQTTINSITLNWVDNSTNENQFIIERSSSATGSFSEVGVVDVNATSFRHEGLSDGETHFYRVIAKNDVIESLPSSITNGTTQVSPPQAPTGLSIDVLNGTSLRLNWSARGDETGFEIERWDEAISNFTRISVVAATDRSFVNSGLTSGETYQYRIRAKKGSAFSPYSVVVNGTTQANTPQTPTGLSIDVLSGTALQLHWLAVGNETGFEVSRWDNDISDFEIVHIAEAADRSFIDAGLTSGKAYQYRIRAQKGSAFSPYSNVVTGTPSANLTSNTDLAQTPQYNGNISGIKWQSHNGDSEQLYTYHYDAMNRITGANYVEKDDMDAWESKRGGFQVHGISYDLNGNIKTLNRQEWNGTGLQVIDQLTYDYSNKGNQLQSVEDAATLQGFRDGHVASAGNGDYDYDANGNMTLDRNKEISEITYNYLNLPERVTKNDGKYILYGYDAAGIKLFQEVRNADNSLIKRTDYVGEYIYETKGDGGTAELQLIQHEEGRIVPGTTSDWEYQYHLKDHLGNTRLTFTTAPNTIDFEASMETENAADEEALFQNLAQTRVTFNGADANADGGNEVVRLNGTQLMGPGISLPVGKGDKLDMEAYGYYEGGNGYSTQAGLSTFISAVAGGFGGLNGGTEVQQATYDAFDNALGAIGLSGTTADNRPAAYLNYILFDENMVHYQHGHTQISTAANGAHERISLDNVEVEKAGYVYIYLSNESVAPTWVYFDDLKVTLTEHSVVQEDDYYPFGLTHSNGYQRISNTKNDFLNTGKERIDDLDLNWDDFGARFYIPEVGRWGVIDQQASRGYHLSPYNYSFNNPIRYVDPDGNWPWESKTIRQARKFAKATGGTFNKNNRRIRRNQGAAGTVNFHKTLTFYRLKSKIHGFTPAGDLSPDEIDQISMLNFETGRDYNFLFQSPKYKLANPAGAIGLSVFGEAILAVVPGLSSLFLTSDGKVDIQALANHLLKASDSSKNEKHGDTNAVNKADKQVAELEAQLEQATTKKEKQKIKNKIKNVKKTAQKNKKGEEHSKANKR